jgi:hypothetical protein
MKNLSKIIASISLLFFLATVVLAQSENRITKGQPRILRNPKWTVIIDYVDSFDTHKPRHPSREESPPPVEDTTTHTEGHFELLGGVWNPSDLPLDFTVDLRGFPADSDLAIWNAFAAWDDVTSDQLVAITLDDADVSFTDGLNTYSMRNLGGGGVLAATFISWYDLNGNDVIDGDPPEPFLEMDVIHNSTVQWGIDESNPKGRWWDVQNVATHELGHVFGLAHPGNAHEDDKDQTMFASAPPKETSKRSLEDDGDFLGITSSFLGY